MCATPFAVLGPDDCDFYDNRMARMEAARPADAADAWTVAVRAGLDPEKVADLQLEAFEAEGHEWWLVTCDAEVIASVLYNYPEEREEVGETPDDALVSSHEGDGSCITGTRQ